MQIKIYYHHTDCGGVVYYANYLKFLEEARTEFFTARGILLKDLAEAGTMFVVARQEIDYKLPAFYADTLSVDVRLANVTAVRLEFSHQIKNQQQQLVCQAKTTLVCVGGPDLKPKPIPKEVRKLLSV
ncbi:MAG: thioesterase family protein [Candidatus Omnitrophota bacterium]